MPSLELWREVGDKTDDFLELAAALQLDLLALVDPDPALQALEEHTLKYGTKEFDTIVAFLDLYRIFSSLYDFHSRVKMLSQLRSEFVDPSQWETESTCEMSIT